MVGLHTSQPILSGCLPASLITDGKIFQLLDADDVEQVSAGVGEVRTEMIRDFIAHVLHGFVEDRRHERHAATTACASFRAGLDLAECFAGAVFHDGCDIALCDVVAGADLRVVCEVDASSSSPSFEAPRMNCEGGTSSAFLFLTMGTSLT